MNRTFRTHIIWYQYAYLILVGLLSFWMLWIKAIIPAALFVLLIVLLIERFIHTTYTLTADNKLLVYTGRFGKTKTVKLDDILSVERRQSQLGRFTRTSFVLIHYKPDNYISVLPMKEREFIEVLEQRLNKLHNPINK